MIVNIPQVVINVNVDVAVAVGVSIPLVVVAISLISEFYCMGCIRGSHHRSVAELRSWNVWGGAHRSSRMFCHFREIPLRFPWENKHLGHSNPPLRIPL